MDAIRFVPLAQIGTNDFQTSIFYIDIFDQSVPQKSTLSEVDRGQSDHWIVFLFFVSNTFLMENDNYLPIEYF